MKTPDQLASEIVKTLEESLSDFLKAEKEDIGTSDQKNVVSFLAEFKKKISLLSEKLIDPKAEFKKLLLDAFFDEDGKYNPYGLEFRDWPKVNEDGHEEDLDMENHEILSLTDDKLTMCAGGDWQEPLTFDVVLSNGRLTVVNVRPGFKNGMGPGELKKKLEA